MGSNLPKVLSTFRVAQLLGVAVRSVANWIDQGELPAHRTPGGHRRVTVEDLKQFLRRQELPLPTELDDSTAKVLIIDREQAAAQRLADAILAHRADYQVRQAHDAYAAGEIVASWHPDAVLLDMEMPGLDALAVCRRLRDRADATPAVLAMTAEASSKAAGEVLQVGAKACLGKPLDIEPLIKELDAALEANASSSTHATDEERARGHPRGRSASTLSPVR